MLAHVYNLDLLEERRLKMVIKFERIRWKEIDASELAAPYKINPHVPLLLRGEISLREMFRVPYGAKCDPHKGLMKYAIRRACLLPKQSPV